MTKPTREWCSRKYSGIDEVGFCFQMKKLSTVKFPKKKMRCPKCNRLLEIAIKPCEDYDCWHPLLPPHKGKYK